MEILLREKIKDAVNILYNCDIEDDLIQIQKTRKEFEGDFTVVVFPVLRYSKNTPEKTGETIGNWLTANFKAVSGFNVIKGFLNLLISDSWWLEEFVRMGTPGYLDTVCKVPDAEVIMVEYSSPNTNKPLHLGHIRNNLLGFSLYRILTFCGHKVIKTNIVNDRGIHICKSMLAWQKFGNGETPASTGKKGDHLVGDFYVRFDREYKLQVDALMRKGMPEETAKNSAPLMAEAREMLLKWEQGDREIVELWSTMNSWVYKGFDETYKKLGVDFDKIYYESDTYKDGKAIVAESLRRGIIYRNDDGSVWADLTADGLDQKLLLRSDGTAVYITQDLGTAVHRYRDYGFNKCLYVVGNEQNYHFQVLKAILKKMGYDWSDGLIHFSYGMVELPEGRMKSREGTVVDADDIIREMVETARDVSLELGKLDNYSEEEKEEIFYKIGLGALKYFILKIDPRKNMTFNPAESIDFNGNTGPFIQYTYARIISVLNKSKQMGLSENISALTDYVPLAKEIALIKIIRRFAETVSEAGSEYTPSVIANYCYELAREYNQFYHDFSILGEPDQATKNFRIILSRVTSSVLLKGMWLLGIDMPERM